MVIMEEELIIEVVFILEKETQWRGISQNMWSHNSNSRPQAKFCDKMVL